MNLEEVLHEAGIEWPRNRKIHCPFHIEKTPSLHLFDDEYTGHWYCFACHKGGLPGDLLYALVGRYPDKRQRSLQDRTEATAGLSAWQPKVEVRERKWRIGATLSATVLAQSDYIRDAWVPYLEHVEALVDDELRELPPFDAHKLLDHWEWLANHFALQFADICDSFPPWPITNRVLTNDTER